MRRLVWSASARRDLFRIAAYLDEVAPGIAETILERVELAPLALLDHPGIGSPVNRPGIRKWPVRGTPFRLLYTHSREGVRIRRVKHAAMDG